MRANFMNIVNLGLHSEPKLLHLMDKGIGELKDYQKWTIWALKNVNGGKVQQRNPHNIVILSSVLMKVISICCLVCQEFHRVRYSPLTRYQYLRWGLLTEVTKIVMVHDEKNNKTSSTERTPYGEAVPGKQSWANTMENTSITWWQATSTSILSLWRNGWLNGNFGCRQKEK